jgi:hypothetical protein
MNRLRFDAIAKLFAARRRSRPALTPSAAAVSNATAQDAAATP